MPADAKFKPQKEINRVKAQLRRLEKEKSKSFPDLGRATYQASIEGRLKDPALAEFCGRLKSIDQQIEEGNAELAKIKAQAQQMRAGAPPPGAVCPYCKAPIALGAGFCGNCGKNLSTVTPAAAPGAASCPSCGSPVLPGTAFCGECGKPVAGTTPGAVAPPVPQPTGPTPPPPAAPSAPTPPTAPTPPGAATPAAPGAVAPPVPQPTGPTPPPPAAPSAPTPLGGTPPGPPKSEGPLSSPPKPPAQKPASPPVAAKPSPTAPTPPGAAAPAAPGTADIGVKPSVGVKPGATGDRPRICPSCSAPIDEQGATFCGECGKKL